MVFFDFRQRWTSAQIATSSFSMLNTLSGAFPCEFTLDLRKSCQQTNDQRCHLAQCFRADETVQCPDVDALHLKVVKAVDDLNLSSAQPVQLGHNQFVFGFQHRQTRLKLMPMLYGRPATDDLVEDVGAPCILQRRHLRIRRLMGGGHPCITHRLRHRPLTNPVFNTNTWTGFMNS